MTREPTTTDEPRGLTEQTVEQLGGPTSLLVRQRRDHAVLDGLLQALDRAPAAEQDELLTRLARLVFPHAYAEETVVWPVLRAVLPDGQELTERNEQEHQEINEHWTELECTPAGTPRHRELVGQIAALLRQDARDEEDLILPRLQVAVSDRRLRLLGNVWQAVRSTAPTRPHALVSRRPPGNLLSSLPLTLVDRGRDRLDRAARSAPALAGVSRGASRALALVGGAVERVPVLQLGEQPSTREGRTAGGRR